MLKVGFSDILFSHGRWSLKIFKIIDYLLGSLVAGILPPQEISSSFHNATARVLIIRPGGIGDAVFLLPILKALKAKGVSVDILCEKRNEQVFSSQGYPTYFYNQLGGVLSKPYDAIVDTEQWHYLSAIVSYFGKTEYRIGFATRPLRAKLFNKRVVYGGNDYELDNFLKLFEDFLPQQRAFDINGSLDVPQLFKLWASQQIPENSVTIFLGASIALRRFSQEQIIEIAEDLLAQNLHPVFLGGRDVAQGAAEIVGRINNPGVFNFVGKTSLMESAALIGRSQRLISPDSGLMHLACAVGTPVLAVFGPGHLEKWQPKGAGHQIITKNVSCSPCTRFGYTLPTCRGEYHCVRNIKIKGC